MNKQHKKINYDKDSAVLSIEIGKKQSVDSDIRGNVVIDYGKGGDIVRINIYNFTFDDFRASADDLKRFARHSEFSLRARR